MPSILSSSFHTPSHLTHSTYPIYLNNGKETEIDRQTMVIRRKRSLAMISKGHMLHSILRYDGKNDTNHSSNNDNSNSNNSNGGYSFAKLDRALARERLHFNTSCSSTNNTTSNTSTNINSNDSSTKDNKGGVRTVDVIVALWGAGATELAAMGHCEDAFTAWRAMGSLFSQLAGIEPYARLLTDLRSAPELARAEDGGDGGDEHGWRR